MPKITSSNYWKSIFDIVKSSKNLGKLLAPIFIALSSIRVVLFRLINSRTPIYNTPQKLKQKYSEYLNEYWANEKYLFKDYEDNIKASFNLNTVFLEEEFLLYYENISKKGLTKFIKDFVFLDTCYKKFYSKEICLKEKENLLVEIMSIENDFFDFYNFNPNIGYDIFLILDRYNNSSVVYSVISDRNFQSSLQKLFSEKFPFYKVSGIYLGGA